jgi:hypothetical protein
MAGNYAEAIKRPLKAHTDGTDLASEMNRLADMARDAAENQRAL